MGQKADARPDAGSRPRRRRNADGAQGSREPLLGIWPTLQKELAALSTNSDLRIIPGSQHYIQQERPDAVVDAVSGGRAASVRTDLEFLEGAEHSFCGAMKEVRASGE